MSLAVRAAEPSASPTPYTVPPSGKFDGADGSWSTFKISVGSPGQDFRVIPSTKGGVTYVIAPEGCLAGVDPANCPQLRGIDIFNSAQNIGFQADASSTWSAIGQFEVDLEEALNYTGRGLFGTDVVSLGAAADRSSSLSLTGSIVSAIADPDYYLGMLGLGQVKSSFNSGSQPVDSTLYQLRDSKKIPSFSYAYTAGAKYRLKSVLGSLILGGYDATRFDTTDNLSFTFSQDSSRLLTVSVDSIMATNTLKGTYSLTSGSHFSVIDSTVPHLWLPESVCTEFETAFGLTYDPQTDLYLVNDTIHQQLRSNNPTLTFKLANSPNGATQNYTNIQLPYAAFDLQASYPFYPNATNYFPIRRAANDSQYALGRTLLQEAYLIVDYERSNFTVAQAVFPDPLPPAQVVTIVSPNESPATQSSSSGLSTGAIVGIAIGAVAGILVAALAFFLVFCRRRRAKKQSQTREQYELPGKNLSEVDSGNNLSTAALPLKAPPLQELSGTPLTELASPANDHPVGHAYPQDQKTVIQVTDEPQELHGDSMVPITPKWCEVVPQPPYQHDTDGESSSTQGVSTMLTDETYPTRDYNTQAAVSPLTPRVPQYRY